MCLDISSVEAQLGQVHATPYGRNRPSEGTGPDVGSTINIAIHIYVGMRFGPVAAVAFGLRLRASGRWVAAPMPRRRPSSGTGTRLRAPIVILGDAEYGLFSVYKSSVFLLLYR